MLTGDQVREACELLWWGGPDLQRATKLAPDVIDRILMSQGSFDATPAEADAITRSFEKAGLAFTSDGGVRLRKIEG